MALAVPAPNPIALPEWYVWTCHGCPHRVLLSLTVIEQLRLELALTSAADRELGGLLIGSKRAGVTRIFEFVPVPDQSDSDKPYFVPSLAWLNEVIARCPSDGKVVGYYRSDADGLIRLRQADLELMQQRFQDPSDVCLVISPSASSGTQAGFFCWQGRTIAVNPLLTFPLSVGELASQHWPIQQEGPWREKASRFFAQISGPLLRRSEARATSKIAGAVALLALVITAVGSRWTGPGDGPPGLGFRVHGEDTRFTLSWNPHAPPIKKAKEGNLVIWDASRADSDGNAEPLHLQIPLARLHSGGMVYTSFAPIETVHFRLDVLDDKGKLRSEAVTSISPAQDLKEAETRPNPIPRRALERRARMRNAVRTSPAAGNERLPDRKFAPPRAENQPVAAARVVMLEPPANLSAVAEAQTRTDAMPDLQRLSSRGAIPNAPAPSMATPVPNIAARSPAAPSRNASLQGMLTITSEPSGAEVQINGMPAGVTPMSVQISPVGLGFTVTVTKDGYLKWSLQTSAMDKPYGLHAELKPTR